MSKKEITRFSIIIPAKSYNAGVEKLVNSLVNQSTIVDEIIIVTMGTYVVTKHIKNSTLKVLKQDGVGPANARNFGVRYTSTDILVFLDSDCSPINGEWLALLLSNFTLAKTKIVLGRIIIPKESIIQRFICAVNGLGTPDYGTEDFWVDKKFYSFPFTNIAIDKSTFQELGGFDENLIVAEDLDFCIRAYQRGIKAKYSSNAIVYHFHRDNVGSLIKHAWKTGKGSTGFIRKYGFWNKFLRGTSISVLSVLLAPLVFIILFLAIQIIGPSFLLLLIIPYSVLFIKFWKQKNVSLDYFLFPLFLALYSISLGLGFLYQLLFRRETNK